MKLSRALIPAIKSCESPKILEYSWINIGHSEWKGRIKQSPIFSIGPNSPLRWTIRIVDCDNGPHRDCSLFLCCEASDRAEVRAKFRFYLGDLEFPEVSSPEMDEYCVFQCGTKLIGYGYKDFCSERSFSCGRFSIHCEIKVQSDDNNIGEQKAGEPSRALDRTLMDDIASVFTTKNHTDFLITNKGVSYPVHKAILSARSPVFAAMLDHDTKERQENRVEISDMESESLQELLRYIYTDKVINIEAVARDLLAASEKYALDRLKDMAEKALRGLLAVDNAAEMLIIADLHRANDLKVRVINFINRETNMDVMNTPGFQSMITSHPQLVEELLRAALTPKIQDDGFKFIPMEEDQLP